MTRTTYATTADLMSRHAERDLRLLTDETGQTIVASRLDTALQDASDEIDAYLGARYELPLAAGAAALVRPCCDIAIYRIQSLRPNDAVEDARRRYEAVVKYLTLLQKGQVLLPGAALRADASPASEAASSGLPRFETPPSVWAREER